MVLIKVALADIISTYRQNNDSITITLLVKQGKVLYGAKRSFPEKYLVQSSTSHNLFPGLIDRFLEISIQNKICLFKI